jgi:hypothetical protein
MEQYGKRSHASIITMETIHMKSDTKKVLAIVLVVAAAFFLLFGGGAMTGGMMDGGMNGSGWMGGRFGTWLPALLTFGLGVFFGWVIFRKKE